MGLFSFLKSREKRLEDKEARLAGKMASVKAKQEVYGYADSDPVEDVVEVTGRDGRGNAVTQQVRMRGTRRSMGGYAEGKKLAEKHDALVEELNELRAEVAALTTALAEDKKTSDMAWGKVAALASGALSMLNASDTVQQPWALVGSDALTAYVAGWRDQMDPTQADMLLVVAAVLKAVAYYDAAQGLSSILGMDIDEDEEGEVYELRRNRSTGKFGMVPKTAEKGTRKMLFGAQTGAGQGQGAWDPEALLGLMAGAASGNPTRVVEAASELGGGKGVSLN